MRFILLLAMVNLLTACSSIQSPSSGSPSDSVKQAESVNYTEEEQLLLTGIRYLEGVIP